MAMSQQFLDHVLELLEPLGGVSAKAMFGGAGLYLDGTIFAIVTRSDVLYFKTDEVNRGEYEAAGAGPFVPFADKPHTMPYHEVPADVVEDAEELRAWAQKAWQAGRRAEARKTPAKR